VSAKSVALIPRYAECEACWLPADEGALAGLPHRWGAAGARVLLPGVRWARVRPRL